ncbi:hypothetical protein AGMMS49982_21250 [Bacteroidia bacterium]|nr:hypothetical protein AGMMS49982_21250 [Bacteroidia bacterium]
MVLAVSSCRQEGKPPVSVIFDTDLGPDYDDVGALTVLHALADRGEARILATVASNRYPLTSICIDAVNHYYGRPELPIGAPVVGTVQEDGHAEKWTEALAAHFVHRINSMDDVPDAVPVYRRILAGEPDSSVVVVTVGFFTNLVALMQSPPDHYSPLNGKELIARKVKRLVSMAGKFPEGREYNVYVDTLASAAVFEQWTSPITFSGFEIGENILTGKRLVASNIQNTPAKEAFTICLRQDDPEGRCSWDQTAVLVAVRGADRYFNTVKGQIKMEQNGANSWRDDPNGSHEYLTWMMPVEDVTKEIEDLMMHEKAPLVIKAPNHYPQPEITWRHAYHQTLMMKMFLSGVDGVKEYDFVKSRDKGESHVYIDFEQALDIIRRADKLSLGIPKIVYLVGWQYNGHDSKYPAWGEVNPKLKRPQDGTALESMKWLMEEAGKYNTTVSLHLNMLDAYDDSPLWDTYMENNIIARNVDGSPIQSDWGWPISYTQEWKTGFAQKRIDSLCDMLPVAKAGTVHIDAFHTWSPTKPDGSPISPYLGYTAQEEEETQRKIFRYWDAKGIDVTCEETHHRRFSAFEGLQPAAWSFRLSPEEYMKWPASYYCGGTTGGEKGLLFGTSMLGEGIFLNDPQQLSGFVREFCTQTLTWYYLNSLQRLEYIRQPAYSEVHFAKGVTTRYDAAGEYTIKQNGNLLRQNGDLFIPALWMPQPAIVAYSTEGYEQKTWQFPSEWKSRKAVDIYQITIEGNKLLQHDVATDGKSISLGLQKDEAWLIVPAGTFGD